MEYICSLCIVCNINARNESDAIYEFAQRVANMNSSELEDYIEAAKEKSSND